MSVVLVKLLYLCLFYAPYLHAKWDDSLNNDNDDEHNDEKKLSITVRSKLFVQIVPWAIGNMGFDSVKIIFISKKT